MSRTREKQELSVVTGKARDRVGRCRQDAANNQIKESDSPWNRRIKVEMTSGKTNFIKTAGL